MQKNIVFQPMAVALKMRNACPSITLKETVQMDFS